MRLAKTVYSYYLLQIVIFVNFEVIIIHTLHICNKLNSMCHQNIAMFLLICISILYIRTVWTASDMNNVQLSGAQYLYNAISDLKKLNTIYPSNQHHQSRIAIVKQKKLKPSSSETSTFIATTKIATATEQNRSQQSNQAPSIEKLELKYAQSKIDHQMINENSSIPHIQLTKGELASLYETAISNGNTVQIANYNDNNAIHAAVHEITDRPNHSWNEQHTNDDDDTSPTGYYYYYYPLKSFADHLTTHSVGSEYYARPTEMHSKYPKINPLKSPFQVHSHTHQHNIKLIPLKDEKKEKKALQPLFMAISGFIGMAVMFVLSTLVLPKFGNKKTIRSPADATTSIIRNKRRHPPDLTDLTRIALKAIEGNDCTERIACEIRQTARNLPFLANNRFIKFLKRIVPISVTRNVERIGRIQGNNNRRFKCTAIPCKKRPTKFKQPAKNKNYQRKP